MSNDEILGPSMGVRRRRTNCRRRSLLVGGNLVAHRFVNVRNQYLKALVTIARVVRRYFTVAVDHEEMRNCCDLISVCDPTISIFKQRYLPCLCDFPKRRCRHRRIAKIDGQNGELVPAKNLLCPFQDGQFASAWRAPRSPECHYNKFAPLRAELDGIPRRYALGFELWSSCTHLGTL